MVSHDPASLPSVAPFAFDGAYVVTDVAKSMRVVTGDGPPPRVDGLTFGMHRMDRDSIHAGELHPDGDELIVVVSGALVVELDRDGTVEQVEVTAGHGCIVPRGVWHRLLVSTPTTLMHATPGPGFDVRWS